MNHDRIELDQALELIRSYTGPLVASELQLEELSGEILAEPVLALQDQPPFPRSPLDGYAIRGSDSAGASRSTPAELLVTGKICAGEDVQLEVGPGEAVRIMTGARIPAGATAVIRQEDTDLGHERVRLYQSVEDGQNYCRQGEDYRRGDLLLEPGQVLDHAAVALLASNGIAKVRAYRKPLAAVITTGDELIPAGASLSPGKIYNTNRYMLQARLRELGVSSVAVHVKDDPDAVTKVLRTWTRKVDLCITTGGVSVGEKDIMNTVLDGPGVQVLFHGVRMKPGSPVKYALMQGTPVLALSGNPFAAAATFEILGRAILEILSHNGIRCCRQTEAVLANGFSKPSLQRRFVRGCCRENADGSIVMLPEKHGSGQIASMCGCNCLVDIPAGSGPLEAGAKVRIWLL